MAKRRPKRQVQKKKTWLPTWMYFLGALLVVPFLNGMLTELGRRLVELLLWG